MKNSFSSGRAFRDLRERAEKLLKEKAGEALDIEKEDLSHLIHELEINQVELELQNEELRRVKGELEGSRNEFAELYESAPVAYVTLDQKGVIEKANQASYRIFRDSKTILGSPFFRWVHIDDLHVYHSFMKEVALNREAGPVELRLRSLEGPLDVRLEATAGIAPGQRVREYRLAFVDITEQKRAGEELRKAKEELEVRVQERTEELARSHERLKNLSSQLLLAQEKERKRVAIELHDGLLSELAATRYLLEGKVMLLKKGKLDDPEDLKRVLDILTGTMREARRIMTNLHPAVLDELGLIAAITWLCGEYQSSYPHIKVQKQIGVSEGDISDGLKVVIFRVLQEALNNFIKHGKGDSVELSFSKANSTLELTIQDNGQGFDVENAAKGLGLESMRERVELSGGEFQLESALGQGTIIRAIWST